MKIIHEPTYSFVILTFALIIVDTLLAWLATYLFPVILPSVPGSFGISFLDFSVAFMILFTLWFGAYGAIAAYAGTLIGSGLLSSGLLTNHPLVVACWSVTILLQVLIPLIAFRLLKVNTGLENRRDLFHLILFGVIINNLIGVAWGSFTLLSGGIVQSGEAFGVFEVWLLGDIVITLLLLPFMVWRFTPFIRKSKLFVRNYWD